MSHQTHDIPRAAPPSGDLAFDRVAQRHHADALAAMSPRTLALLRSTRHAATSAPPARRGLGWLLASGSAAVLALAIAVQLQREPVESTAPLQASATAADGELDPVFTNDDYLSLVAGLDENPDLYLWLAANDQALPGAMTP